MGPHTCKHSYTKTFNKHLPSSKNLIMIQVKELWINALYFYPFIYYIIGACSDSKYIQFKQTFNSDNKA